MINKASADVAWGPSAVLSDASEIDEPRARGAYLESRISWVLGLSLTGSAAVMALSFLEFAIR